MSREAIATAVSAADAHGDKYHVEPCPRCKQAIKLPLDQLRRSLPPDWTPTAEAAEAAEAAAPSAEEPAAPSATVAEAAEASTPPAPKEKPRHHHRAAHKPE